MCSEDNAGALEVRPYVEVIVQFAVEYDGVAAIGGKHRLMPALNVDDT